MFDTLEARLGAVSLQRLANATASIAGGAAVSCIFDNEPTESDLGQRGVSARAVSITCSLLAAGEAKRGTAVSVSYRGSVSAWSVAERDPDDLHMKQARLILVRA